MRSHPLVARSVPILVCLALPALALVGCQAEAPATDSSNFADDSGHPPADQLRRVDPPSGDGAMAPNLAIGMDGSTVLSWLEPTDEGHTLFVSSLDGDNTWTPPIAVTSGSDFFANWADLPATVEADSAGHFAHWLAKLGDSTYAYGVQLAHSPDGGTTWNELGLLHDDDSPTEHGFVSYAALPDGGLRAFWLDGRAMAGGGSMHLRTATVDDQGVSASQLLDDRVCECCATDAAIASNGPVVVYRNRSQDEIRDIAVIRATADGWSQSTTIHDDGWKIFGCPVNGPAIAARDDLVAVAWFTDAQDQSMVQLSFSTDGGATFGEPVIIDAAEPVGRVDVEIDASGAANVSWLGTRGDSDDDRGEIRWRRVEPDGTAHATHTVATTSQARSAGVPRMIRHGDRLLFVWVDDVGPARLRAGLIDS